MNDSNQHQPDSDRLSVLTATVLLAYALTHVIETQRFTLNWSVLGIAINLPLNITAAATFLAAVVTAAGMNWLLRTHPQFTPNNLTEHWLLPALTAFMIGIPLYNLPNGPAWWLGFGLGGGLLILVFMAEYITQDGNDVRYPLASAGLIALSFALFTVLCAALEYVSARLVLILLVVFPAAGLVSLRSMHLRLDQWRWQWAFGIGLACTQVAAALHYWPISPVSYGLAVLAPLYAMVGLGINLGEGTPERQSGIEATIVWGFLWLLAFLLR